MLARSKMVDAAVNGFMMFFMRPCQVGVPGRLCKFQNVPC